eukprot:gb/GECH01010467.1/.p1 GENE.gb/GECH01010467.1/~~gb/GECH01010467.1/.p1  ORF type:complete len:672 (+),score=231.01 gb/GECH01010467.1/:1-2016(+)
MPKGEAIRKYSRKPNRTSRGKTKLLDSIENINQKSTVTNVSSGSGKDKSVKNNSNYFKKNNHNNMPSKNKRNNKDSISKNHTKNTIEDSFYSSQKIEEMKPIDYEKIFPPPSKSSDLMRRAYKEMQRVEGLAEFDTNEKLVMWSVREIQTLKHELEAIRNLHVQHINNLRVRSRQVGAKQTSSTKPKIKTEPVSPSSPKQKDSKLDDYFAPVKQISNENIKQEEKLSGSKRRRTDTPEQTPPTKRRRTGLSKKASQSKKMRGLRKNVVDDDDEYDPSSFGDHPAEDDEEFVPDVIEELTDLSESESQQSQQSQPKSQSKQNRKSTKKRRDTTKKRRSTPRTKKMDTSAPSTPTTPTTGTPRRRTRRKEIPSFNDEELFPEEMEFEEKIKKGENQTQQFWNHVGLYFEPITPKLLERLEPQESEEKDPAFNIPPLGRHYKDIWATEDSNMFNEGDSTALKSPQLHEENNWGNTDRKQDEADDSLGDSLKRMCEEQTTLMNNTIDVKEASDVFNDHSLSQRLLSALVEEPSAHNVNSLNGNDNDSQDLQSTLVSMEDYKELEMLSLEERLVKELKDIGVLNEEDKVSDIDDREDDEICAHIRSLQSELRGCVSENNKLKRVIREHVQKEAQVEQETEAQMQKDQQNLAKYERLMREKKQKGKKGRKTTKKKKK